MSLRVRHAGPLAAVMLCAAVPGAALARNRDDMLVAQIAQARPAKDPFGGLTPLRSHPRTPLGGDATPTSTPTPRATATATPVDRSGLPSTGSDPALVALAGLSLFGFGLSLRLRVALGDARDTCT